MITLIPFFCSSFLLNSSVNKLLKCPAFAKVTVKVNVAHFLFTICCHEKIEATFMLINFFMPLVLLFGFHCSLLSSPERALGRKLSILTTVSLKSLC